MIHNIANVTDNNFEQSVLQVQGLSLVDFWAPWCNPCKSIAPILEEIADEFKGKITLTKLNIDKNPVTVKSYGVRSVPSLLLFRNGELIATKTGALSKKQLKEFLNAYI